MSDNVSAPAVSIPDLTCVAPMAIALDTMTYDTWKATPSDDDGEPPIDCPRCGWEADRCKCDELECTTCGVELEPSEDDECGFCVAFGQAVDRDIEEGT